MATAKLSKHERGYIIAGIEADFRADGRRRKDFRSFNIHQGVISNTNGSAQLQLVSFYSATRLICWTSIT